MGLSTKQVYGDDHGREVLDQTLVQAGSPELSKSAHPLKCPRCGSTNTKFCYFNNYNKSQPRHFCKSCKRHWTKGGTLRNVPAGGGRKKKRPKIINSAAAITASSLGPQNCRILPLSNNNGDQKTMSNIISHALIRSPSSLSQSTHTTNGINKAGLNNVSVPSYINSNTECSFSFLSTKFDIKITSLDSNPTTYQSLKAYDHHSNNRDSIEEFTITTVNTSTSSPRNIPLPNSANSGSTDLPSYWDWNDIDYLLTSSDHLNIYSRDDIHDLEIKP